ncbi:MAG: hypothetical protein ISR97_00295 [Nitrospira sp.]|nr:hypothetical protein [Nitrospira sp.]
MAKTRWFCVLFAVIILIPVYACTENREGRNEASFKQQPEIAEIKPQRPVKIKLKRGITGQYSWDLSGDDAGMVLEADRQLKEGLGE